MSKLEIINSENCWLNYKKWVQPPPSVTPSNRGNNILHFNSKNRGYEHNEEAQHFVDNILKRRDNAKELESDAEVLMNAVEYSKKVNSKNNSLFLEFGFCTGRSLNFIAALAFEYDVYGFDSGMGLPKDWRPGFPKGTFRFLEKNKMPFCPLDNTGLIMGLIKDTLPVFKEEFLKPQNKKLAFIHIDTDIYDSAATIFNELEEFILPDKTVIVLDEGYNYWAKEDLESPDEFKKHELKASEEFALRNAYDIKYLFYNKTHQQLSFIFK